jgi:N-acetylmuramoyl-L-alanine amidase
MGTVSQVRLGFCGVVLTCLLAGVAFAAETTHTTKRPAVLSPWEQAQRQRAALEERPVGTRTRGAYDHVLDAFRAIYHDNPRDAHAAEAVYSVAELLAEEGRELEDEKSLRAAIGQYEFLRKEYPFSPLRPGALLAEGQIEADDLGDEAAAKGKLLQVVKEAPRSAAAKDARVELADKTPVPATVIPTHRDETAMNGAQKSAVRPVEIAVAPVSAPSPAPAKSRSLASVTGIRHWSTPTYTRVAIDLGDEVTFEAARVPNPDRIYFDLHGAKLGAELVGKSFDVTDDGFLKRIRAAQAGGDVTRVVLDVNDVTEYSAFLLPNPYRLIIDIHGAKEQGSGSRAQGTMDAVVAPVSVAAATGASVAANRSGLPAMALTNGGDAVRPMTPAKPVPNATAVKAPAATSDVAAVSDAPGKVEATNAPTSKPIAAVVRSGSGAGVPTATNVSLGTTTSASRRAKPAAVADAAPGKAADKTADGETSLVRALGLKIGRIVIDAGHGGHDSGTLGADGIQEKDVVLDVALRVGKLLHDRLGAEIIYTRSDDTFIPLETRTAIANKAQADLFLSIHANSSADETARGVETYYLNFTSDPTALDVAARENAVGGQSIHQLSDLVKKITLKDKIAESREFAQDVEGSLYAGLEKGNAGLKNRGVKKAPFVVLIGANMPSILAEISFVTNPKDAEQLRNPDYRERVAESLFAGVAKYESGLAGAKPVPVVRASAR